MAPMSTWRRTRAITGGLALLTVSLLIPLLILGAHGQDTRNAPGERWRQKFKRPGYVPQPPDNPSTPEKVALGARLFAETQLSDNGKIACATCHNPVLAFSDGVPRSEAGTTGVTLKRHTPSLWNVAWTPVLYWDGRASSLEDQARFPISHADEMASSPEMAAARLTGDASYRTQFAAAFPDATVITGDLILKALAVYQRCRQSLLSRLGVSPARETQALYQQLAER